MSVNEIDFGVSFYETLRALSSLEFLKPVCGRQLPQAPMAGSRDLRLIEPAAV